MPLSNLSDDAVAFLVKDASFDVGDVIALIGGNPLFVADVLVSGTADVPSSIKDAVLARAAKLSPGARQVLNLVSVVPGEAEVSLVDTILQPTTARLMDGESHGLLQVSDLALSFPHELQRRAIDPCCRYLRSMT
jgi:hypothetical protein